ncbi:MAG TPA: hypothetical protein VEJ67_08715 [Candidatus Cybelea sp.]|nr:hypothetical protein [Candidatus Cybelea sp.]
MIRRMGLVCVGFVLLAWGAGAQTNPGYGLQLAGPTGAASAGSTEPSEGLAPAPARLALSEGPSASPDALPAPDPAPPQPPQGVYGVFPKYDWEASVGYQYVRFYEVPGTTENTNGYQGSVVYYPEDLVGAEGELSGGVASGSTSRLFFGGAGARVRWSGSRKYQLWAHGLVGLAGMSPKTLYGSSHAFGYELGAGVDIKAHATHWSFRAEGDADGTFYFGTYQVSPKVAVSAVYKF